MYVYKIIISTDSATIDMCQCLLLATVRMVCHWLNTYLYGYNVIKICLCHYSCPIMSLHPPSYNIIRCGLCLMIRCFSFDPMPLIVYNCHESVILLTLFIFVICIATVVC